jgi:hypothetical protein
MVKPPVFSSLSVPDPARDQREIRDWHTLVAKLASEAETLHSWTERPPSDDLDSKIQGTLTKLASGLAGDARRLAGALPEGSEPSHSDKAEESAPEPPQGSAPKAPGTGLSVDKTV